MAVDETMRKLRIPSRFLPYLEKHRIYELFHEIGNELALSQPQDSLKFIKQFLHGLNKVRNKRIIILMTTPYLDRIKLAQLMSVKTGCGILSRYIACLTSGNFYDPQTLAENTSKYIKDSDKGGWILADYPDTEKEARLLIKAGVIPTHVFLLLSEEAEDLGLSCYETPDEQKEIHEKIRSLETTPSILLEYENSLHRLQDLFKSSLKMVQIDDKSLEELADACTGLTLKAPAFKIPKLFRISLIGPRGSRRKTIAKVLQNKYQIVHVDIHQLINSARVRENGLGDLMRRYDKENIVYPNKLVFELLTSRLYQHDCLDRGYVLTNYPTSVEDFVLLDSIKTPPSTVIFLDIEREICLDRQSDRVVNTWTGKLYSKRKIGNNDQMKSKVLQHPDDEPCKIEEELKFYYARVQKMMDYCGNTGIVIDAKGTVKELLERVESVLMRPALQNEPRTGKLPLARTDREYKSPSTFSASEPRQYLSYPVSRTEVTPLFDRDHLMERYLDLKKGYTLKFTEDKPQEYINLVSNEKLDRLRDESENITEETNGPQLISIMTPKTSEKVKFSSTNFQ